MKNKKGAVITKKKATKVTTATKAAKKQTWSSKMVRQADLGKAAALIKKADALEVQILDAQEAFRAQLGAIAEALQSPSFEHPERGPMTIQTRGEKTFWRSKPMGNLRSKKKK